MSEPRGSEATPTRSDINRAINRLRDAQQIAGNSEADWQSGDRRTDPRAAARLAEVACRELHQLLDRVEEAKSPALQNMHLPGCRWERTTSAECGYRATHHYCPHAEHACNCPPAMSDTPRGQLQATREECQHLEVDYRFSRMGAVIIRRWVKCVDCDWGAELPADLDGLRAREAAMRAPEVIAPSHPANVIEPSHQVSPVRAPDVTEEDVAKLDDDIETVRYTIDRLKATGSDDQTYIVRDMQRVLRNLKWRRESFATRLAGRTPAPDVSGVQIGAPRGWCVCEHHRGEHGPLPGDTDHLLDAWGECRVDGCACRLYRFHYAEQRVPTPATLPHASTEKGE